MTNDPLAITSILLWIIIPVVVFAGRHWIIARISKGIQHQFDRQIEELRAELRSSEERLKSDLRDREAEIAALRNNVLAGSASRQALLDKRCFEAVERVWADVNDLAQLKFLSGFMAELNFDAMAKEASDPRMKQFLDVIGNTAPDVKKLKNIAKDERPFLPELAWAYYSAYKTILVGSLMRFMLLKTGLDNVDKLLKEDGTKKILKAVLPHQSKFIDEYDSGAYHYLLEEIESLLLAELRKILEGRDADQLAAARAKQIMDVVKSVETERTERGATA